MKKIFIIPLIMVFLMGCSHVPQNTSRIKPEYINMYYSSVTIKAEGIRGGGSGTIIWHKQGEKIKILTAAHVANGLRDRWFEMVLKSNYDGDFIIYANLAYSNTPVKLKIVKTDDDVDLALLESVDVATKNGPFSKVANDYPNIGDTVFVVGAPMMNEGTLTTGIISNMDRLDPDRKLYRITAPIFFGNSGGGVFNSKMELIGAVNSGQIIMFIGVVPGAGFCVSLEQIRKFL